VEPKPSNDNARPHQGVRIGVILWDGSTRYVVVSSAVTDTLDAKNHKRVLAEYLKVEDTNVVGITGICHLDEKDIRLNRELANRCGYIVPDAPNFITVGELNAAKTEFSRGHLRVLKP